MVSEPKLLTSEMAAQARDRSFEALIETIGELKKMLEDITARLPIPTPPQPGNTSSTSGKEPIPPEPPDLLTPTQNTFNRAAALTSNGNSFLRPSLSVTAARTKTYASSNLSDLKKLIAANSEIVAPKVFEEMPHSSNINKIDALLSDNGEQAFAGYDVEINNDKLADEVLENDDALQHDEKPAQTRTIDESFVAKEAADSGVFKVFDEMPRTFDKPKMKMMDQIAKAVDDLLLLKASGEGKLSLKALKVSDLKAGKALLAVKGELTDLILVLTEFPTQGEISLDHMSVMSFDPGGQPIRKFNELNIDELQFVKVVLGNFNEHKEEVSSDEDRGNSIVLTVDKLKDSISCFDPGGKHNVVLEATEKSGEVAQVFDGFVLKNWPEKLNMKNDNLMVYEELVFDPGGGASEPRIDFHRSRYGNFSDYLVHQLGKVVAKVDTRVICFDPGGVNQWVKLIAQGIRQNKIEKLIWFWGMKFDPGGNCLASCYPREYFLANDALWIPISLCGHNVFTEMITPAETYESRTGALLIEIYALKPKLLTVMQWTGGVHFLMECAVTDDTLLYLNALAWFLNFRKVTFVWSPIHFGIGISSFNRRDHCFKRRTFDPGGNWSTTSDHVMHLPNGDEFTLAILGERLATGAITAAVILLLVTWEFGLRLTFDPGRECKLLVDELHFEITPVSLAKELCVLRARELSMFTDLIKLLAAFPVQEGIPTPYIARLENGELMLKTESKENLLSFCSMSMQKLEHIDEETDEIMNSPGASLYSAEEELLFVECVVYLFTGIKPLLANVNVSRKKGSLWCVEKRLGSNDRYALGGMGTFFLVTTAAAVEILTFDPRRKEFMPYDLVFDLSNKSELNHSFPSRLKHSGLMKAGVLIFVFDPGGVHFNPTSHCHHVIEMSKFEVHLSMILGDKDPLKRGVLMQDFSLSSGFILDCILLIEPGLSGLFISFIRSGLSRFRAYLRVLKLLAGTFPVYRN